MRIALIIERLDPSRGGRETSTVQIATELIRRGHEVTVLCESHVDIEGLPVRVIPVRGVSRPARLRNFVHNVQRVLTDESIEVSHAMLPVPGARVYQLRGGTRLGVLAARRRMRRGIGVAMAQLSFTFNEHRRLLAGLERQVISDQTLLLPNSEMVAREIEHHYGRSEGVIVVSNGVAVPEASESRREQWRNEYRQKIGAGPDETVFLTAAKHYHLKGVDWAIRAFAHAFGEAAHDTRLVCIGQTDASGVRRIAEKLGVAERVTLLPPTTEMFSWYSAADVCVLLSWYDASSRVVLEATRWGLPSITTTYNGAAEVLSGGAGIVVERPDARDEIAGAMKSLTDPERRHKRSVACAAAAEDLTIERHVDELLAVYNTLG
ncbi:MAG: glycosyltransferase family 4 protein [Phycisphaerae bacterium]|nr:glycosyltransferase family 4 protein [Phycisphaerae bacterium]